MDVFDKIRMRYLPSVNTPDFSDAAKYILNPDKSLRDVPPEYIKLDNASATLATSVSEMSAAEKAAVDAAKPKPTGFPCPYGWQEACPYAPEKPKP